MRLVPDDNGARPDERHPGVHVIKLFFLRQSKLECFPLAILSSLVLNIQERSVGQLKG
jgi:hypothetical protein